MEIFTHSAQYYDLLYKNKPYEKEAEWVLEMLQKGSTLSAGALLSLGCGTCRYERFFANQGWHVTGIDQSSSMLTHAEGCNQKWEGSRSGSIRLVHAELTTFELEEIFDGAVALFHVVNYLPTQALFTQALKQIAKHLKSGSPFLFNSWNAPGVLASPPTRSTRHVENEQVEIKRIGVPHHDTARSQITVDYTFYVTLKAEGKTTEHREQHTMRYLTAEEVTKACIDAGFCVPSLHQEPLTEALSTLAAPSWSVFWLTHKL